MKNLSYALGILALLSQSLVAQKFGIINDVFTTQESMPSWSPGFELDDKQAQIIEAAQAATNASALKLETEISEISGLTDANAYREMFRKYAPTAQRINEDIVAAMKQAFTLADRDKIRQIAGQQMLKDFRFEEFIALNSIKLTEEQWTQIHASQRNTKTCGQAQIDAKEMAVLLTLEDHGIVDLGEGDLGEPFGYGKQLSLESRKSPLGKLYSPWYDDTRHVIATLPRYQEELGMTLGQVQAINRYVKELSAQSWAEFNTVQPVYDPTADASTLEESRIEAHNILKQMSQRDNAKLHEILNDKQMSKRLDQLALRAALESAKILNVISVLGPMKEIDKAAVAMAERDMIANKHYNEQAMLLQVGIAEITAVVEAHRIERMIGEPFLISSPLVVAGPNGVRADELARQRLLSSVKDAFNTESPKRNRRR